MQPRGRRRHRARLAREHGLIVGAVLLVDAAAACDIRRQRHVAAFGQRLSSTAPVKAKASVTSPPLSPCPFCSTVASSCSRKQTRPSPPKRTVSPTASRFAGLTSARQRDPSSRPIKVAAMAGSCSPRPSRRPCRLAGKTFVSLTTTASPRRNSPGKSRTMRFSSSGVAPGRTTRSLAASRGDGRSQRDAVLRQREIE